MARYVCREYALGAPCPWDSDKPCPLHALPGSIPVRNQPTTDRAAIHAILAHLTARGYRISGHDFHKSDCCESPYPALPCEVPLTVAHVTDFIASNLDECNVYLRDANSNRYRLWFVLGNEPYEVLADYAAPTDELLDSLTAEIDSLCDAWE